jgi:hypothetical protein
MKPFLMILGVILLLSGCTSKNEELQKANSDLTDQNKLLKEDLRSRDEYIESVTQSVNDVYSALETVRSREKLIMSEAEKMEARKKLTSLDIRAKLLSQIAVIDTELQTNRRSISNLQSKVSAYKYQYTGVKQMIAVLQSTIEEREQSIADLEKQIRGLEDIVNEKTKMVEEKDSILAEQYVTIEAQRRQLATGYYIVGTRRELEEKGIIKSEGGVLWGLFGSTTTLASGLNPSDFLPINKAEATTITVKGRISELVPVRKVEYYSAREVSKEETVLDISTPAGFWQNDYLVIITD